MQSHTIYIKGMVCQRCISTIQKELEALGLTIAHIELGAITILSTTPPNLPLIAEKLAPLGFSILEDKNQQIAKSIKILVETVYSGEFDFPQNFRFSKWVSEKLYRPYDTLSAIFSTAEGITLEKYIIAYRVEKIKELLVYTHATLSDIAFRLGFSSEAHLSRQFKAQTGLNPSYFIKIRKEKTLLSKHRE